MGFPLPLAHWIKDDWQGFLHDIFSSQSAKNREFYSSSKVLEATKTEGAFSRKVWAFIALEMWFKIFIDEKNSRFPYISVEVKK